MNKDNYDARKTKSGRQKKLNDLPEFSRLPNKIIRAVRLCEYRRKFRHDGTYYCTLSEKPFLEICKRQRL